MVNEEHQILNFGPVKTGSKATLSVPIINRSKRAATITLSKSIKLLANRYVTFNPNTSVTIKPKEILNIDLAFEPKSRIPNFSEELSIDVEGTPQPLLYVSGSGTGIELKLENDIITFGNVVQHGSSTQKVRLTNIGDLAARFKWDSARFQPDFSVSPVS